MWPKCQSEKKKILSTFLELVPPPLLLMTPSWMMVVLVLVLLVLVKVKVLVNVPTEEYENLTLFPSSGVHTSSPPFFMVVTIHVVAFLV